MASRPTKLPKLSEQRENILPIELSNDVNEIAEKKSPGVGCLKGLKRKRLKFGDLGQTTYEKLPKDVPSSSQEKENRSFSQLSLNSCSNVEPTLKKRRLGTQHPRSSSCQTQSKYSNFLKSFWKSKTESFFKTKPTSQEQNTAQPSSLDATVRAKQDPVTLADSEIEPSAASRNLKTFATPPDFIKDLFHGQLVTTIKCMECESKVHRYESFQVSATILILKFELPEIYYFP